VRKKRKKAEHLANFIVNGIGMKRAHFMGIVRNGIEKRVHMAPEAYLSKLLKRQISGIGFLPMLIEPLMQIIDKIISLFGGKKDPALDQASVADSAPDPQPDFASMSTDQQNALASNIANQPVPTFTAASYAPSSGGGGGGGSSSGFDSGAGGDTSAAEDAGGSSAVPTETAATADVTTSPTADDLTGGDAAQASTGWC
jgi:hypothetical protein